MTSNKIPIPPTDDHDDRTVVDTQANVLKPVESQFTPAAYEDFVNYPALLDAEDERYRTRSEQLGTDDTVKMNGARRGFWQWLKWFVNRNDPPRREE